MRKISNITQWCLAAFFGLCIFGTGLHWSSILLVFSAVLMMPLPVIRNFLKKAKIKSWLAITLSTLLLFVGVVCSPQKPSTKDKPSSNSATTSSTVTENKKDQNQSSVSNGSTVTQTPSDGNLNSSSENDSAQKPTENITVGLGQATPPTASSIPEYLGQIFVPLNENLPNFSADELKAVGYEKYGELDSLKRVTTAIATLGTETMPKKGEKRGDISKIKPTGWVQKQYDDINGKHLYNRCHLIGWQLSAENANQKNLITGTRYFNTEGMLPFENMVADYIKETGNHVAYRVTPIFEGDNLLCLGVQIEAYSIEDRGDGICFNIFCYNVQPDITIDYKTGESSAAKAPEQEPDEPPATTEPAPETPPAPAAPDEGVDTVWIPTNGGKKYHSKSSCSSMIDPKQVTKDEAVSLGFGPCGRCYK